MDPPFCNELTNYSDHLQRQMSQQKVPFAKYGPIQMTRIICKNKVLSLAILFARANSTLSGSFAKTKCGAIPPYLQKFEEEKISSQSHEQTSFQRAGPFAKTKLCAGPYLFWQRFD